MTPSEIVLTVIVVILLVAIARMVQVWRQRKPEPKNFGLREAENFLARVPEVTGEEIKKLIMPWTIAILGYTSTVVEDVKAAIATLRLASDKKKGEIKQARSRIRQLEQEIAGNEDVMRGHDSRIDRLTEVSKIFGGS